MGSFKNQLKHVSRRLGRAPLFTSVTIVTIAIAVGANTAIFSVVNGILLKPLPYPDPATLMSVGQSAPGINIKDLSLSPSDFFTFREENRTFQHFGIWGGGSASVTGLAEPEQVRSISVTDGILDALAIPPAIGRWFSAKDATHGSPETVLLTYGYWQRRFGGDAGVLGRRIVVDGSAREVIGVMPQSFQFLDSKADLILPFQFDRGKTFLGNFSFQGIARLKPGVPRAQANADLGRMIPIVNTKFPPPPGFSVKLFADVRILPDVRPLKQDVVGDLGKLLWVLMASIGTVLLIACANVANLLLVRAEGRQQELGVRAALGAGSGRIASELLMESTLLGLLGGAVGLALAYGALRVLVAIAPAHLPRLDSIAVDPTVLLFTLAISLASGFLFGLAPVVKYARPNVVAMLRAGGRTSSQSREAHRARAALVMVQVALAVVLLISSGLMIRTFRALRVVEPGFRVAGLQTFSIEFPEAQVKEPERVVRMFQEIGRRLSAIPGVSSVAFANCVPSDGNTSTDVLYAEDRSYREGELPPLRRYKFVTPGFFHTVGVPLIAGRDLTWADLYDHHEVVLVSENMAREMWHDPASALGKRIREGSKDPWREIVGVVGDVRDDGADQKPPTLVYWPLLMSTMWGDTPFLSRHAAFAVATPRAGSEALLKEVRQAVWSVNRETPLDGVKTMEERYRGSMARNSFTLVMLSLAGGMALLLGIVGIYGVISYSVSQRTREIGIRIALGAGQKELRTMVVRQGIFMTVAGLACGLGVAAAVTRVLSSLLFETSSVDPVTYLAVSAGLLAAAATASYLPARKASAVDPVDALRAE